MLSFIKEAVKELIPQTLLSSTYIPNNYIHMLFNKDRNSIILLVNFAFTSAFLLKILSVRLSHILQMLQK